MAKKTVYSCAYLRVDLTCPWVKWSNDPNVIREQWLTAARDMKKSIERHCDVESVTIEANTDDVCQFCGRDWTEDNTVYNGGCCNKDEQDYQESISFAAAQEGE